MESDLISRDAVLNFVNDEWYKYKDKAGMFEIAACTLLKSLFDDIERIEAVDAVEVVRCKDCIFYNPYEGEEHKGECEELVGLESCVYEDDFCSYGFRMEE